MRTSVAIATLLVAVSAGQAGLHACGDKFFLVGRADRFARAYASLHPGRIVIYTGGSTDTSKALKDGRLQKHFKRAGHQVSVAQDTATLDRALQSGEVDLVLAGLTEALDLVRRVDSASSKPTLLPVANTEKDDLPAQHQFAATLKTSDRITGFLAKIEGVMKARSSESARP
jgi:ABC-type amino acid transport substrate-binding protein